MGLACRPSCYLEKFFKRPRTTGQGNETIGQFRHPALASVHVGNDVEPRESRMFDLAVDKALGITPWTEPPAASAESATPPINRCPASGR